MDFFYSIYWSHGQVRCFTRRTPVADARGRRNVVVVLRPTVASDVMINAEWYARNTSSASVVVGIDSLGRGAAAAAATATAAAAATFIYDDERRNVFALPVGPRSW